MKREAKKYLEASIGRTSVTKFKKLMCGPLLHWGQYRDVYLLKGDSNYVAKIERDMSSGQFCNVCEWRNWANNRAWQKFSEWLAPCYMINEQGTILIQERVKLREKESYPKKIPSLFTDRKYTNFGWLKNQFVCCDYAFLVNRTFRMRNARWVNPKELKDALEMQIKAEYDV